LILISSSKYKKKNIHSWKKRNVLVMPGTIYGWVFLKLRMGFTLWTYVPILRYLYFREDLLTNMILYHLTWFINYFYIYLFIFLYLFVCLFVFFLFVCSFVRSFVNIHYCQQFSKYPYTVRATSRNFEIDPILKLIGVLLNNIMLIYVFLFLSNSVSLLHSLVIK
jgi:hypothetical protein